MAPSRDATVGVVGLGRMGTVVARAVAADGPALGWDVRALPDAPVPLAAAPEALVERCDVILCCLPSPKETRAVLAAPAFRTALDAASRRGDGGPVIVDTSTSDPASLRRLAADLGAAGARLLDAPILGRPESCGAWTLPVGGDEALLERARPTLEAIATTVRHVGPLGAGHTIKLLNNMMFAAINVVAAEAVGACERLGIDPESFVDLVGGSAAATVSPLFRDLAPRMVGRGDETVFTVALLHKDLQLAARMCEEAGVPLITTRAQQIALARALDEGLEEEDTAALVRLYRRRGDGEGAARRGG